MKGVGEVFEVAGGVDGDDELFDEAALRGGGALEVLEEVAELGGFFELHFGGGFFHFDAEAGTHFLGVAFEEVAGLLDAHFVGFGGDFADAWGGAVFDDVVEAVAVVGFGGGGGMAGAQAEEFFHEVEGGAEGAGVGKGAEVAAAVVAAEAGELEAGEGVGEVDADEEETFIVAETDVVAGTELFDEFAFEEEGFWLGADGVEFEVVDGFDEGAGFEVSCGTAGGVEVLVDAFVEVAGFADVDDAVETIFEEVDAWAVGEEGEFFFEVWG